jgi:hypothetical protein
MGLPHEFCQRQQPASLRGLLAARSAQINWSFERHPQKSRPKTAFCFFFADSAPVSNGGNLKAAGLVIK